MHERGRNSGNGMLGAEHLTAATGKTKAEGPSLMDAVVERNNLWQAYRRVVGNGGAPGVDNLTVSQFKDWLKEHWPSVKAALLNTQYMPQAVRAVDIPNPRAGSG
jgi:RNA-directed DNA polymerase